MTDGPANSQEKPEVQVKEMIEVAVRLLQQEDSRIQMNDHLQFQLLI